MQEVAASHAPSLLLPTLMQKDHATGAGLQGLFKVPKACEKHLPRHSLLKTMPPSPFPLPLLLLFLLPKWKRKLQSHPCPLQLGCIRARLSWVARQQQWWAGRGFSHPAWSPQKQAWGKGTPDPLLMPLSLSQLSPAGVSGSRYETFPNSTTVRKAARAGRGGRGKGGGGICPWALRGRKVWGGFTYFGELRKVPRSFCSVVQFRRLDRHHCIPFGSASGYITCILYWQKI